MRERESTDDRNRWEWLKRGKRKSETEILLCAAQEQALRVNAIKYTIDKTSGTPLCRLCNVKTDSITHIVSACSILAKSQYRNAITRLEHACTGCCVRSITYNAVTSGKHTHTNTHTHTHTHSYTPQSIQQNDKYKILWNINIQTDKVIDHRRPDIVFINKLKRECQIIDFAIPGD